MLFASNCLFCTSLTFCLLIFFLIIVGGSIYFFCNILFWNTRWPFPFQPLFILANFLMAPLYSAFLIWKSHGTFPNFTSNLFSFFVLFLTSASSFFIAFSMLIIYSLISTKLSLEAYSFSRCFNNFLLIFVLGGG